jgi:hypothetical protein
VEVRFGTLSAAHGVSARARLSRLTGAGIQALCHGDKQPVADIVAELVINRALIEHEKWSPRSVRPVGERRVIRYVSAPKARLIS